MGFPRSDEFVQLTGLIGFIKAPLEATVNAYVEWQSRIYADVRCEYQEQPFPEVLGILEPLTVAHSAKLWIEMGTEWTAYFDSGHRGSDPSPPISVLSESMERMGVIAGHRPNTFSPAKGTGHYGSVQFRIYGPYRRSIGAVNDGGRWTFVNFGDAQEFEEQERYSARRVRDRFDADMLERYCAAVGIDIFNPLAYGPRSALVRTAEFIKRT